VIPFEVRVAIFRQFIANDQSRLGRSPDQFFGHDGRAFKATIRRNHLAEDGYRYLNDLGPSLKEKIRIEFIDQFGEPEAGIDGGGLFKEFLNGLSGEAFDANRCVCFQ
jgi:ubiquitin-protein ligase E3 C